MAHDTQPPCLTAALHYLELGWSPIPLCPHDHLTTKGLPAGHGKICKTPGKTPLWEWKEFTEKRPSKEYLEFCWERIPEANVGVCLGPVSGLLGIDIDGTEGEAMFLEWLADKNLPDTLQFKTPNGRRLLFLWPGADIRTKSFKGKDRKEAIKIMGKGSQTVMPPSIHHTCKPYCWCHGLAPVNYKEVLI